jgi:hypothetical protein
LPYIFHENKFSHRWATGGGAQTEAATKQITTFPIGGHNKEIYGSWCNFATFAKLLSDIESPGSGGEGRGGAEQGNKENKGASHWAVERCQSSDFPSVQKINVFSPGPHRGNYKGTTVTYLVLTIYFCYESEWATFAALFVVNVGQHTVENCPKFKEKANILFKHFFLYYL